jgi:hypothetical protein
LVHTDTASADWYLPVAQATHVVDAIMPMPVLYKPAPQLVHTDTPVVADWYVPAAQLKQAELPAVL